MRNSAKALVGMTCLLMGSAVAFVGDSLWAAADSFGGNQLTRNYVPWYQKAATVGPASGIAAKKGTLLTLQPKSFLYLEGDSTLHKYQMRAGSLKGAAEVKVGKNGNLLESLENGKALSMALEVPLRDFKSREADLDHNAYKALKAQENPEIRFELQSESLEAGQGEGTYQMTAVGNLSVAGTRAPVTLTPEVTVTGGQVELKGTQALKMSDFKVTPPSVSLVLTAITCKDEVEIHYDVVFAAKAK